MDKKKEWPDTLKSYFKGSKLRKLNQLYVLILAPFCYPTYFTNETGTKVDAYLTQTIRADQKKNLKDFSLVVENAMKCGSTDEPPEEGAKKGEPKTMEAVVLYLMGQVNKKYYDEYRTNLPHIGSDLICRAGNRFLSGFALEEKPQIEQIQEQIQSVKDYYRLCICFSYPDDNDGSQKMRLCDCLLADLSGGLWNGEKNLPEDPAEKAAHLLLAYLFLKYYIPQSFGSARQEVRKQLRDASKELGFSDPSAQQPSQRFLTIDAEKLMEVIKAPLTWKCRDPRDSVVLCDWLEQTIELLKDGDSILEGFGSWLDEVSEALMKHDQSLQAAFSAAPAERRKEILDAQKRITELRMELFPLRIVR